MFGDPFLIDAWSPQNVNGLIIAFSYKCQPRTFPAPKDAYGMLLIYLHNNKGSTYQLICCKIAHALCHMYN